MLSRSNQRQVEKAKSPRRWRKVGVFRALCLGDMLCSVPALRALKKSLADHVTLISLPWAQQFAARFGEYVDDFIPFPGFPGLVEQTCNKPAFFDFCQSILKLDFDLLIQLHGNGVISNSLCSLLTENEVAGYYQPGNFVPNTKLFFPYPSQQHEIRRNLQLIHHLGADVWDEELEFPLQASDFSALRKAVRQQLRFSNYVCLHPGAKDASRRWPVEKFAQVGDQLAAAGFQVVLTGRSNEINLTQAIAARMRYGCFDSSVLDLPLGPFAALLSNAKVVICNDTGPSHLASALKVPSVVVYCQSELNGWAPLNRKINRVLSHFREVTVQMVIQECFDLLQISAPFTEYLGERSIATL